MCSWPIRISERGAILAATRLRPGLVAISTPVLRLRSRRGFALTPPRAAEHRSHEHAPSETQHRSLEPYACRHGRLAEQARRAFHRGELSRGALARKTATLRSGPC